MWLNLFLRSVFFSPKKNALRATMVTFAIAVMPLTLIYTLSHAMVNAIYERSVETFFYHAQVLLPKNALPQQIKQIRQLPYIDQIWQEKQNFAVILNQNGQKEALLLRGLEPSFLESKNFWKYLSDNNNKSLQQAPHLKKGEIALARGLASKLKIQEGQTINILTSRKIANKRIPRITPLKVKLIFSTGYSELDNLWGLLNLEEEPDLFDAQTPSIWGVKFNGLKLNEIETLTHKLNQEQEGIKWLSWSELNANQKENFQSLQVLFYVLFSLLILVAGFNLSSAIVIYMLEQAREIAILKIVGLSAYTLRVIFTFLATFVGFCGCLMGVLLSLVFCLTFRMILTLGLSAKKFLIKTFLALLGNSSALDTLQEGTFENSYLQEISPHMPFSFIAILLAGCLLLSAFTSLWATRQLVYVKPKVLLG